MTVQRQTLLMPQVGPSSNNTMSIITFQRLFRKAQFANMNGKSGGSAANKRIMVVDDEKDISMIFKSGLQRKGFIVDVFNDPQDALDSFRAGYYDLLLLDVRMPKMNGFELWREVRKKDMQVRVCFVSAFEVHEEELKKYLPDDDEKCIVKKPVSMKDLISIINETLSQPE